MTWPLALVGVGHLADNRVEAKALAVTRWRAQLAHANAPDPL
jgi:hypothetical protein